MRRLLTAFSLVCLAATVAAAQPAPGSGSASASAAASGSGSAAASGSGSAAASGSGSGSGSADADADGDVGPPIPPGTVLQVYTKPIEPFAFQKDDKAQGFSLELWQKVSDDLHVTTNLHWVTTVTELINALKAKQADVAVAAISITSDREKAVDFSTPYYESGLGILVNAQGKGAFDIVKETFWTPTILHYALALLVILIVVAHLVWFFERINNPEQFPKPYVKGIWEASWWAISTILSGGCDAKGPNHILGRIFGGIWMLCCIIVITYFTAAITTVMTVSELTSDINGPNDLPGKAVATVEGSTAETYLKDHGAKVSSFKTIDEAFDSLDKHDVIAVVYDKPILSYHVKNAGSAGQSVVGLFQRQNYGIGLQDKSPYRKRINAELLKLAEDGTIDDLRTKWFGDDE